MELMKSLLSKEGFTIEWEKVGDKYLIHETSCPYYHISQTHPEVCAVDQILISSVLSTTASKTRCILNGDNFCTYVIPAI
jgi:predicted ArsR family transcriptional regulator